VRHTLITIISLVIFFVCSSVRAVPYESELLGRVIDVPITPFEITFYTYPAEGDTNTVYLGDNMISQKYGYFTLCLEITQPKRSRHLNLTEGEICQKQRGGSWYTSDNRSLVKRPDGLVVNRPWARKVGIQQKKRGLKICNSGVFGSKGCVKDVDPDTLVETDSTQLIESSESLQQNIEYLGKDGDILNFAYTEFKGGLARDAFTRQFVVDLSEDNVLAFKGALIEIQKATSSRITYKILRNFSAW
jgi:hypothetical protein